MLSKHGFAGALVAAALLAAACGSTPTAATNGPASPAPSASPSPSPSPTPTLAPSPSPTPKPSPVATGAVVKVGMTRLGDILVNSGGRTIYLFLADKGTTSTCNSSGCVLYWPPVLTKGAPQAGAGVNASLLATTRRTDGTTEVTYAGHPLYYLISDKKPGDVTGQGINGFGGLWYVVSPSGVSIR